MMNNFYYEYEEDGLYCYPGTYVLRNNFGIKDPVVLSSAERDFSSLRASALDKGDADISETFDARHLREVHRFLFADVYEWAGEYRCVNISKGSTFCLFQFIPAQVDELFARLAQEDFLRGMDRRETVKRLAFYLGELNAIHPFREGNGRVQRAFVRRLAYRNGYLLSFAGVTNEEMVKASASSFNGDNSDLEAIIERCLTKID